MSKIFTVAEFKGGGVGKPALETLGEARRLADGAGARVGVILVGSGAEASVGTLGRYSADEVFLVDDAALATYNLEAYGQAVLAVAREQQPDVLLVPGTVHGRELAPWVAAALGTGCAADVVALSLNGGVLEAVRPMYSGKVRATVKFGGKKPQIATLRPNIFAPVEPQESRSASVTKVPFQAPAGLRSRLIETKTNEGATVELSEARVIVSGGRGLKGPENFEMLDKLAGVLGGAVGASRMVVDLGWKDHAMQVGQTGKVVNPELYIAVGISGAIQHLVGMQTSKYIVAINKDADAPIFKIANYGIVGDAFEVVPLLTEELRKVTAPVSV
jgi:electron transfer flavoprotein alpha subunit